MDEGFGSVELMRKKKVRECLDVDYKECSGI